MYLQQSAAEYSAGISSNSAAVAASSSSYLASHVGLGHGLHGHHSSPASSSHSSAAHQQMYQSAPSLPPVSSVADLEAAHLYSQQVSAHHSQFHDVEVIARRASAQRALDVEELINDRVPRSMLNPDQNSASAAAAAAAASASYLNYHVSHHGYLQQSAIGHHHHHSHHHLSMPETVDYQDVQQLVGQRREIDDTDHVDHLQHQQIVEQINQSLDHQHHHHQLSHQINQIEEQVLAAASNHVPVSEDSIPPPIQNQPPPTSHHVPLPPTAMSDRPTDDSEIVISDVPVQSRARASLPVSYLFIEEVLISHHHHHQFDDQPIEQIFGVFARKSIPQRTQFGPVEGVILQFSGSKPHSPQPNLIVFISETLILDQSDENKSNWMRFVRTALSPDEQNLELVTKEQTHPNPNNENELITTTKVRYLLRIK